MDICSARRDPGAWAALATLIAMEVVLGLDNFVLIALLSNRIDAQRRGLARGLGLSLALLFRLALLASASWAAIVAAVGVMMAASGPLLPDSHKLKSCYR
jgi:predicted tellurium resistance membrane protein TerC